jgi:Domain of unknown function (DUF4276)
MDHPRFHPFLALHELEAWIFAAPIAAEEHLGIKGLGDELAKVAVNAGGPELVNEGSTTHPSIRLATTVRQLGRQRRYGKVADGPEIISKAGLNVIRTACPHFCHWLEWLESPA